MTGRFDGQTILITGGSRGMGASHARGFIAEGANVVIGDVLDDEGHTVAAELGPRCHYLHLDVSDPDQWAAAVTATEAKYGPIAVLINNAGFGTASLLADTSTEDWRGVLSVIIDGTFYGIRAAVPSIRRNGGGAIINISSYAGLAGTPLSGSYTTSKFALRGLTRVAAMELGCDNIRVNSIHPGYVATPALTGLTPEMAGLRNKLAIVRMAESEEVTKMVLFVASEDAAYCTGSEFVIDGGWSAGSPVPIGASEALWG
ncbi:3alpha(or 20beta)-hydroxysteroid dehydrogenase [Jatrophihabitans sp. GAS493]|uniref:SDR family oxidoreductase n=1 Tax=Jatrophihabitans sp. GAS493 TaxID=1907575 RepID=UPI000BC0294D|nr:3alpha(or 20beta)-hydroxysteroid dehydrogenase [Jatrophihabitans sp. GAS493]